MLFTEKSDRDLQLEISPRAHTYRPISSTILKKHIYCKERFLSRYPSKHLPIQSQQ